MSWALTFEMITHIHSQPNKRKYLLRNDKDLKTKSIDMKQNEDVFLKRWELRFSGIPLILEQIEFAESYSYPLIKKIKNK